MKKLTKLWQTLHYSIFMFNKYTQLNIFGLPFFLLLKNKYIKRIYQRKGIKNPEVIIKKSLTDPEQSTIIWIADISMCILFILMILSFVNIISSFLGIILFTRINRIMFVLINILPALIINYYLLWKEDKYLIVFKEFDKEPKNIKRKKYIISFLIVIGIIILLIFSFWIMLQ